MSGLYEVPRHLDLQTADDGAIMLTPSATHPARSELTVIAQDGTSVIVPIDSVDSLRIAAWLAARVAYVQDES